MGKSNAKRAARRSHLAGMAENIATSTGSYHCYRLLRVQIENAPAIDDMIVPKRYFTATHPIHMVRVG